MHSMFSALLGQKAASTFRRCTTFRSHWRWRQRRRRRRAHDTLKAARCTLAKPGAVVHHAIVHPRLALRRVAPADQVRVEIRVAKGLRLSFNRRIRTRRILENYRKTLIFDDFYTCSRIALGTDWKPILGPFWVPKSDQIGFKRAPKSSKK